MENNKLILGIYAASIFVAISVLVYFFVFWTKPSRFTTNNSQQNASENSIDGSYTNKDFANLSSLDNFNQNDFTVLNKVLDAKITQNSSDLESLIQKSLALSQEGSLTFKEKELGQKAIDYANMALKIDSNSARAYFALGYANEIQELYTEAIKNYEKSIAIQNTPEANFQLGHIYDLQGDTIKAKTKYLEANKLDPNFKSAIFGLARIAVQENRSSEAIDLFKKVLPVLKNAREIAEVNYSLGSIYFTKNNLSQAYPYANASVLADDSYPLAKVLQGKILIALAYTLKDMTSEARNKAVTQAFQNFSRAIEINPNQTLAFYETAFALSVMGKKSEAVQILGKAKKVIEKDITLTKDEKVYYTNLINDLSLKLKQN